MKTRITTWLVPLLCAGLLHGCGSTTPHWDSRFGKATQANLAAQTIDPAASANPGTASGIDGRAARAAYDNYQRSFAQPETGQPTALIRDR